MSRTKPLVILCASAVLALALLSRAPVALCKDVVTASPPTPAGQEGGAAGSSRVGAGMVALLSDLLSTHPRILAAQAALEASGHHQGVARSRFLPSVDATLTYGEESIAKPAQDTAMTRKVASVSARQLLYDFGGASGAVDKAQADRNAMLARLAQTRQMVLHQGITAYLNVVRTRENVRHANISVESIQRLSGIEDAMVARGAALSYDALQMKAQLSGALANRIRAERSHVAALTAFAAVFGFSPSPGEVAGMEIPQPSRHVIPSNLDTAVEAALVSHPLLAELKHLKETRRAELKSRESSLFPRFDLVLEGLHKHNDQGVAGLRTEGRASVQLGWNLYSGGRDSESVSAAKAEMLKVQRAELDRRRLIEEQSRNAWAQMVSGRQGQRINQLQSEILKRFLDSLEESRKSGSNVRPITIIVGERDYLAALDQAMDARTEAEIGLYTLLMSMGALGLDVFER